MIILSMIGIMTIIVLLILAIKEMHRTQIINRPAKGCSNTNQDFLTAEVNINQNMRFKSNEYNRPQSYYQEIMKRPSIFSEKTYVEAWMVQLEIN